MTVTNRRFLTDEFLDAVGAVRLELCGRSYVLIGPVAYELLGRSTDLPAGWDARHIKTPVEAP